MNLAATVYCVDCIHRVYIMGETEKLSQSFHRLQYFDLEEKEDVEGSVSRWFSAAKEILKCDRRDMTAEKFMGPNKQVLSRWLSPSSRSDVSSG